MLFGLLGKKDVEVEPVEVSDDTQLFQTGAQLLEPHQKLMNHIRRLSSASSDGFDLYYLPVIERFAESMQLMPVATEGQFSKLGGAIEKSLLLIVQSLRVRQAYLLPSGSTAEHIAKTKELWTYAVFLSALFHRCGQGFYDFELVSFNKKNKQNEVRYWPGISQIDETMCFYKIRTLENKTKKLQRLFPIVVLPTWLGPKSLNWLLSNDNVMETLLAYMAGGTLDENNDLMAIIKKANQHISKSEPTVKAVQDTSNEDEELDDIDLAPLAVEETINTAAEEHVENEEEVLAAAEETNIDWLDRPVEDLFNKILDDLKGSEDTDQLITFNSGSMTILYPAGLKAYTKSPSELKMKLKATLFWDGESKGGLDKNSKKTITLKKPAQH
jgi:hypothetical protein